MENNTQNNPSHPVIFRHQEVVQLFQNKSEVEVWNAFNLGDERAFNFLYRVYTPVLYRYGLNLCQDEDLVKDSIQNIFIYLRSKRGNLSEINSVKGYLYKTLQNEIFKEFKRRNIVFKQEYFELGFLVDFSPEIQFIAKEDAELRKSRFNSLLGELTKRQRQAILLLFEENLSYKEIANLLGLSDTKSARKLVYRGLSVLKAILNERLTK
jgi:RNA polymerase sigma-70 factor (ECF subfamily)